MKILNKYLIAGLVLAVAVTSCKKSYFDVNQDPNRPNDGNITPALIYNNAAVTAAGRNAATDVAFINRWIGYWSTSGDFAIDQQETSYNIDFSFSDPIWRNQYDVLFDLYKVKQKAEALNDKSLAGASIILSAKLWQDLVDVFGDVPYSQAFTDSITSPKYDKAQDVYADLQKQLDAAIEDMKETDTKADFLAVRTLVKIQGPGHTWDSKTDIAYIQQQWMKFANTLKLRLLIRQSEVSGENAAELAKIQQNGGLLGAGESVAVNPGFANAVDKQSTFYQNYGTLPTGNQASTNTKANDYVVSFLKAYSDSLRLKRFFKPIATAANPNLASAIVGTTYGLETGNPGNSASSDMGPGVAGSSEQDQWMLPSFESLFLQAEAVTRGWLPGDPRTVYENAVKESFVWLGVPDAVNAATKYLSTSEIADWDNFAGNLGDELQLIGIQKYLSLTGIDPIESWSDQRRLNVLPDGYQTANPAAVSKTIPVRLLYPQTEYTTNNANVNAAGKNNNAFTTKIFWQP